MASIASYPHIEKIDGQPARLSRLPRIRVSQIAMDYLDHHWTPEETVAHYPHLQLAEVYAAMTYYFDHKQAIDDEISGEQMQVAQWGAEVERDLPPVVERLRGLKRGQTGYS
jgi:Protein of unknown function (DUF433)